MRKILLTMFAALALVGCNREDAPTSPQEQNTISFGTVDTRAGLSDLQANGFDVWATVSSIGSTDVSYQPILTKEPVIYSESEGWTYDNEQMWIPNSIFHFFAAYPHNVGVEEYRAESNGVWRTGYMLNVTADGSDDTEDILVASNVVNTADQSFDPDNTVDLSFSHLLTKFNLTISQNTDIDNSFEYYITKVSISGLKGSCTYRVAPSGNSVNRFWQWQNATSMTLAESYVDDPICLREDYGSGRKSKPFTVWGEDGIMLLPHTITEGSVMITIEYLYDIKFDDDSLGSPRTITGFIPAVEWTSNSSIKYNISIADTNEIKFEKPTIESWGSPQTGGTIIIK